jgi:hypothetical protein
MIRDTTLSMCKPFEASPGVRRAVREDGRVPEEFWRRSRRRAARRVRAEAYGGTAMGLTALASAADRCAGEASGIRSSS